MAYCSRKLGGFTLAALFTAVAALPLLYPGSAGVQSWETFLLVPHTTHDVLELGAHFSITAALTTLWRRVLPGDHRTLALVIVGLFSVATEFSQYFVGRRVSMYDLITNFAGIFAALMLSRWWGSLPFSGSSRTQEG